MESLRPVLLFVISAREVRGRGRAVGTGSGCGFGEEWVDGWTGLSWYVITVELVPGRDIGEEEESWISTSARSATFLFFEAGLGGEDRSGLPNARPAAATPTVLDATSFKSQHKLSRKIRFVSFRLWTGRTVVVGGG